MTSDPTVVFVNYLSTDNIRQAIDLLLGEYEVLVVSNSSADEGQIRSLEEQCPRTRVVMAQGNVGFAGGLNVAAETLGGRAMMIVNPDARLGRDAASDLVALGASKEVDVLSPTITDSDGRIWFCGGSIDRRMLAVRHRDMGRPWVAPEVLDEVVETEFVSGCLLLISSTAVQKLFPLKEDLFMYWEDAELSVDAANAGLRVGVAQHINAVHQEGQSSSASPDTGRTALFHYYQARNRILVARRTLRAGWPRIFCATVLYLPRAIWGTRVDTARFRSVLAVAVGTVDGVRGCRGRSPRKIVR